MAFSSLFIGMVCEANNLTITTPQNVRLSVPSSSGWCVKQQRGNTVSLLFNLSVPSSSGWCVKRIRLQCCLDLERALSVPSSSGWCVKPPVTCLKIQDFCALWKLFFSQLSVLHKNPGVLRNSSLKKCRHSNCDTRIQHTGCAPALAPASVLSGSLSA